MKLDDFAVGELHLALDVIDVEAPLGGEALNGEILQLAAIGRVGDRVHAMRGEPLLVRVGRGGIRTGGNGAGTGGDGGGPGRGGERNEKEEQQ